MSEGSRGRLIRRKSAISRAGRERRREVGLLIDYNSVGRWAQERADLDTPVIFQQMTYFPFRNCSDCRGMRKKAEGEGGQWRKD